MTPISKAFKGRLPPLPPAVENRMRRGGYIAVQLQTVLNPALEDFCADVRAGKMPKREDLLIVAAGLEQVLAGVSARQAFNLRRPAGRKATDESQVRDKKIHREVLELMKEWGRGSRHAAAVLVAQRYGLGPESVLAIYKKRAKAGAKRQRHS